MADKVVQDEAQHHLADDAADKVSLWHVDMTTPGFRHPDACPVDNKVDCAENDHLFAPRSPSCDQWCDPQTGVHSPWCGRVS
jgi:hypothetical protein